MTWHTITGAGSSTATKFFGDVMNKINNMFNGADISDTVTIHPSVTWTFKGNALRVRDSDDSHSFLFEGDNISANRTITIPALAANDVLVMRDFSQLLKNKKLEDSTTTFVDDADNAKAFRFEAVGITTGTTRVITMPDYNATMATLAGPETLTNKKLTDTTTEVINNSDNTKKLKISLAEQTTGKTITLKSDVAVDTEVYLI